MESVMAKVIALKHEPVAIVFTNTKPEGALQFKEGKFGCIMAMFAATTRGRQAAFDRKTFGCPGGGTGLGFGNQYLNFVGGLEGFCHFLSIGYEGSVEGMQLAEQVKPYVPSDLYAHLVHGERYAKSPERVNQFVQNLPIIDLPSEYVVFKPLKQMEASTEQPEVVVFLVDPDQLAGLVVLANYDRDSNENVTIPWAAGCQSIGIYPFAEARREKPRAVVGLVDPSARLQIKRQLKDDLMSFAMPFQLYLEMERNIPGSFLEGKTWQDLMKLKS